MDENAGGAGESGGTQTGPPSGDMIREEGGVTGYGAANDSDAREATDVYSVDAEESEGHGGDSKNGIGMDGHSRNRGVRLYGESKNSGVVRWAGRVDLIGRVNSAKGVNLDRGVGLAVRFGSVGGVGFDWGVGLNRGVGLAGGVNSTGGFRSARGTG